MNNLTDTPQFINTEEGKRLLQKAEEYLQDNTLSFENLNETEIRWLVQKLRIYQIELEMQNEELKHTQEQLQESKTLYAQLFQLSPAGLALVGKEGLIEKINTTLATMLNQQEEDLLNTPLQELFSEGSKQIFLARFKSFFNNPMGKTLNCTTTTTGSGDQIVCIQGTALETHHSLNRVAGDGKSLLLSFHDITEQKRIEYKLAERDNWLRFILDNSSNLILTLSPERRFLVTNRALLDALGYTTEELGSLHFEDICHPLGRKQCTTCFDTLLAGTTTRARMKVLLLSKDGLEIEAEGIWSITAGDDREPPVIQGIFKASHHDRTRPEDNHQESERILWSLLP